jgi:hypothetical protein
LGICRSSLHERRYCLDYPVSQDTGKDLDTGISVTVYVFGGHEEAFQLLQETLTERGDVVSWSGWVLAQIYR